ncbi:MAG: dTDP-4-dehydrorhamnose 3,5-epimerase [Elusimicrobiales bacterium]|nr:dTDP-4-dehydrorhamnose 3,5-epimerase [Elusimicrobiales bacterium]
MKFEFIKTQIKGLLMVRPETGRDERGTVSENYKASEFRKAGIKTLFVQENRSVSRKNVLRGLHYQRAPHAQAKLVRCGHGRIFEAVVDLRPSSRTYGKAYTIELSEANGLMLFIPEGFAHGFYALTDHTEVMYKCSKEYAPSHDTGLRWNDPDIAIKWPCKKPVLSAKDKNLPFLAQLKEKA